jgi:hypothetical protein
MVRKCQFFLEHTIVFQSDSAINCKIYLYSIRRNTAHASLLTLAAFLRQSVVGRM